MTDICKCKGLDCPRKESCYRYTCDADPLWQAYFAGMPEDPKECKYYIAHSPTKTPGMDE